MRTGEGWQGRTALQYGFARTLAIGQTRNRTALHCSLHFFGGTIGIVDGGPPPDFGITSPGFFLTLMERSLIPPSH
jgi:hypothetical protein